MLIELQTEPRGVIIPVHAQPGARRNGITGVHAGRVKVAVTQAPEKGKANQALIEVLAQALALKRSQILLLSGDTSQHKRFLVTGSDLATLHNRFVTLLDE